MTFQPKVSRLSTKFGRKSFLRFRFYIRRSKIENHIRSFSPKKRRSECFAEPLNQTGLKRSHPTPFPRRESLHWVTMKAIIHCIFIFSSVLIYFCVFYIIIVYYYTKVSILYSIFNLWIPLSQLLQCRIWLANACQYG